MALWLGAGGEPEPGHDGGLGLDIALGGRESFKEFVVGVHGQSALGREGLAEVGDGGRVAAGQQQDGLQVFAVLQARVLTLDPGDPVRDLGDRRQRNVPRQVAPGGGSTARDALAGDDDGQPERGLDLREQLLAEPIGDRLVVGRPLVGVEEGEDGPTQCPQVLAQQRCLAGAGAAEIGQVLAEVQVELAEDGLDVLPPPLKSTWTTGMPSRLA